MKRHLLAGVLVILPISSCDSGPAVSPPPPVSLEDPANYVSGTAPLQGQTETSAPTSSPVPPTSTATPTAAVAAPSPTATLTPTPDPLAAINPSGQEVVFWHPFTRAVEDGLAALVDEFNASNERGIVVLPESRFSYDGLRRAMEGAMTSASGELPGLAVGYQNDEAYYYSKGALVDMTNYVNSSAWGLTPDEQADFFPAFFEQDVHAGYGNARLGFPPGRSMEVMYYNVTWARELGFEYSPETPAEFEEQACAAAATRADGRGGYVINTGASSVAAWILSFGGEVQKPDGSGYSYNSPQAFDFFTMMKRMYDQHCAWLGKGFTDPQFAARQALFAQGPSQGIPFYRSSLAQAGNSDEWAVIPIPYLTDTPKANVYGGSVMIPKTTPEKELAAWLFVRWFTQPEQQVRWDTVSGYFPVRQSAASSPELAAYKGDNPQWAQALDLLPFAVFEPRLISYTSVRGLVESAYKAILQSDGSNIAAQLTALDEEANRLQEEMGK